MHRFSPLQSPKTVAKKPSLLAAITAGNTTIVRRLLEGKADAAPKNNLPLLKAIEFRHISIMLALLEKGADISVELPLDLQEELITEAASKRKTTIVQALLEAKVDPKLRDNAPLREAVKNGDESMVKLLLDNKADVNASTKLPTAEALREHAAHVGGGFMMNYKFPLRFAADSPVQLAVNKRSLSMLRLLVAEKADVSVNDNLALHFASYMHMREIVVFLVEQKADVNVGATRTFESLTHSLGCAIQDQQAAYMHGEVLFRVWREGVIPRDQITTLAPWSAGFMDAEIVRGNAEINKYAAGGSSRDYYHKGYGALELACIDSHFDLAHFLIANGAESRSGADYSYNKAMEELMTGTADFPILKSHFRNTPCPAFTLLQTCQRRPIINFSSMDTSLHHRLGEQAQDYYFHDHPELIFFKPHIIWYIFSQTLKATPVIGNIVGLLSIITHYVDLEYCQDQFESQALTRLSADNTKRLGVAWQTRLSLPDKLKRASSTCRVPMLSIFSAPALTLVTQMLDTMKTLDIEAFVTRQPPLEESGDESKRETKATAAAPANNNWDNRSLCIKIFLAAWAERDLRSCALLDLREPILIATTGVDIDQFKRKNEPAIDSFFREILAMPRISAMRFLQNAVIPGTFLNALFGLVKKDLFVSSPSSAQRRRWDHLIKQLGSISPSLVLLKKP